MPNNNPQQQTTPQQQIARAAEGASKAAERLGESAEHATSVAIEKVRQVRDDAQSGIEQQRDQVAERIRRLSGVLRAGSQTLSTDDPLAQQLFETAGERIEQVADYIKEITPGDLADDITSLARRRPGLFFGGSFILGLALGRFVKSSASVAVSGSDDDDDDEYENTLAVRPTKRGRTRKQRRAQHAQTAGAAASQRSSTGGSAGAQASSSAPSHKPAATASPSTAGSTSTGTVGSGSSHGPSNTPSYGASSTVTTASRPQVSSSQTPASSTARDVERGEGNKS
jgi:hypothetical protein